MIGHSSGNAARSRRDRRDWRAENDAESIRDASCEVRRHDWTASPFTHVREVALIDREGDSLLRAR